MEINFNKNIITDNLIICPNHGQVKIGKVVQRISPLNMKIMMLLVKNQGQVVSRTEIFNNVWNNQEVSDDTLTKCISDLRSQIGKEFIKTLPKRGYQWIPEVRQSTGEPKQSRLKVLLWIIYALFGLFILSITTLWLANKVVEPNLVRIAILPINIESTDQKQMANHIESILQSSIIESDQLKLLSSSVLLGHAEKPFPYLNYEYGVKWVIEGHIKTYQAETKVTLSLVDARTALVVYSVTSKTSIKDSDILNFCNQFTHKFILF